MRIARESWIITAICIADLITTLWFVGIHGAGEANPIMRFFLLQGVIAFILAKCLLFVGPLVILEWARCQRPVFVRSMLRVAIAGYIGMYGVGVWKINAQARAGIPSDREIDAIIRQCAIPVTKEDVLREMRARIQLSDIR